MREITHRAIRPLSSVARQVFLKWSDGSITAYIIRYDEQGRPTYGDEADIASEPLGLNWIPVQVKE